MLLTLLPTPSFTLALGLPHGIEWVVLLVLGVLLFGRRLPEIARGLGKSIVEFKRGVKGIEDEVESSAATARPAARLEAQPGEQLPLPPPAATRTAQTVSGAAAPVDSP